MRDLRRIPLPRMGWTARAEGHGTLEIPPFMHASIHAALEAAGLQSPWKGERAELDSEWVGRTAWTFACTIDVPAMPEGRSCALVIDVVDGPCEIVLGGIPLGSHASEHIPFEARVPDALRGTRVALELHFKAPVDEVLRWQAELGERPVNGDWTPFCFARSAACGFGWDWGPRVPGVGFYGARFDCWNETRITGIAIAQQANGDGSFTVRVTPRGEFDPARIECVVREREGSQRVACDADGVATLRPERLWSTWDRGGPAGSWWNAMVGMRDAAGVFRPIATTRFALRRIELDTSRDATGRAFTFILNGVPLYARGANLIPPLLGRRHEHDWLGEMRRYRDTGFNMVRVWGGGNYLPDGFHEACDELGILVWQDFMFACATYPEDEPFATLVAREAAHQVQRLSQHPSLALWCGGNEDILAWWSWGWKERLREGQSWGLRYWTEILPNAVAAHDPGTPYWTESPYSGSMELHPNDPDHGDRHTWDAEAKIEGYRTILPRFSSEFGHQSPPCWSTVVADCLDESRDAAAMTAVELVEAMRLRQKAWGGDDAQYRPFLDARFRPARSAREYVAQAQHLQARAMSVAMRWLRAGAPRSMGALIWQWNDVWAGHSWSLVDVRGTPKPAWHAVRGACAGRMLSIEPTGGFVQMKGGSLEVVLTDDCFLDTGVLYRPNGPIEVLVERMDFDGTVRARASVRMSPIAVTATHPIPAEVLDGADPERECLVARVPDEPELPPAVEFLAPDASLRLPEPTLELIDAGRGLHRARVLLREAWVEPASDADFSIGAGQPAWRTVLPGEEIVIPEGRVLWTANHFAKHREG